MITSHKFVQTLDTPIIGENRKLMFTAGTFVPSVMYFLSGRVVKLVLWCCLMWGSSSAVQANDIQVNNVSLTGRNTSAGSNNTANYTMIQFNLTWENSWRSSSPANWDAAWVFAKFRVGDTDYLSAPGATNSGTTITVHSTVGLRPGMPVFVQSGTGAFAAGTVITSITNATTFEVSTALTTALSGKAVVRAERIWEHCWLHDSGHNKGSIGAGASVQVGLQDETSAFNATSNPALGAYFYRATNGTGTFTTNGAQLRWNYAAQGLKDDDIVQVQVFAVEMTYVPQGTFEVDTIPYNLIATTLLLDGDGSNGAQNNTFIDSSSNNFTVTRFGNTTQGTFTPFCNTGGSGYFDGSGDYVSVPDDVAFDLQGVDYTFECWVYFNSLSNQQSLVSNYAGSSAGWAIQKSTGNVIGVNLSGDGFDITGGTVVAGKWYHIALSCASGSHRLFIDGVQSGSTYTGATNMNTTTTFKIGYLGTATTWLNGYLSNVRLIKGTALYTANFTPPAAPLTAVSGTSLLLKFENGPLDDSRNLHNVETVGNAQISTAESKFGGASMAFDGSGDYLNIAQDQGFQFGTGDFTIEGWFYLSSTAAYRTLFENGTYQNGILLRTGTGTSAHVLWINNVNHGAWGTPADIPLNTWIHIALVRNGTNVQVYVDGVSKLSVTSAANIVPPGLLRIGSSAHTSGQDWNGYIDDFRITKGMARYTANFTPPAAPFSGVPPVAGFVFSSENQLTLGGTVAGNLQYPEPGTAVADDFNASTTQTLPAAFPKGYNGFYTMKYELSQDQWLYFFNALSSLQKPSLDITDASGKNSDVITFRNNISWTTGDATLNGGTHGNVACNYLSWVDAMAYADWAGLRPMTELEYEKAARGTATVQSGEPASGDVTCNGLSKLVAVSSISNSGAPNEGPANADATAVYNNLTAGPMRTGLFATAATNRASAGSGWWGIMELSGNLSEQVVSIGSSAGRTFTGAHGNGSLTPLGYADVSTWPGYDIPAASVTGAAGSGRRGGSWASPESQLLVSDRFGANTIVSARDSQTGFRAARSQPSTPPQ